MINPKDIKVSVRGDQIDGNTIYEAGVVIAARQYVLEYDQVPPRVIRDMLREKIWQHVYGELRPLVLELCMLVDASVRDPELSKRGRELRAQLAGLLEVPGEGGG